MPDTKQPEGKGYRCHRCGAVLKYTRSALAASGEAIEDTYQCADCGKVYVFTEEREEV
jgi:DNA-directed RNA polymerase subunit RPC12/RpoP